MPEDEAVRKIRGFVENAEGDGEDLSLREMAKKTGLSKWHFHRTFVRIVGCTPGEWVKRSKTGQEMRPIGSEIRSIGMFDFGASELESMSSESISLFPESDISEEEWEKLVSFDGAPAAMDSGLSWRP